MAKLEAYLALEETVIDLLQRAWTGHAAQLTAQIVAAAEAERYDEAHALADQIDSGAAFTKLQGRLRELAVSSLILGASNVVPVKQTLWVQGRPPPRCSCPSRSPAWSRPRVGCSPLTARRRPRPCSRRAALSSCCACGGSGADGSSFKGSK